MPEKYPHIAASWQWLRNWDEQGVWLNIWRAFLDFMYSMDASICGSVFFHIRGCRRTLIRNGDQTGGQA